MAKAKILSPKPESASFAWKGVLCDDIRQESNNRVSLMGVYLNDEVGVDLPAYVPDPTPDNPIAVEGISILLTVFNVEKLTNWSISLLDPHGVETRNGSAQIPALKVFNTINKFRPFSVTSFGKWKLSIKSSGESFEYEFSVLRGPVAFDPDAKSPPAETADAEPVVAKKLAAKRS